MSEIKLMLGNNLDKLKELKDNSVDSVVTDPPYGLSFMNKKWDHDVPSVEFWKEVLRVLKPGGHVLSFGGTRTYHRMAVNIEDAGFEIRDQIMWLYGSGFPKSLNVGKKIPEYEGFGTALKPANEPIVLARKPLSEKTIVDNVLKWGTGALNIDGCKIPSEKPIESGRAGRSSTEGFCTPNITNLKEYSEGRWPANVILDEIAGELLDEQSGVLKPAGNKDQSSRFKNTSGGCFSTHYENQKSIATESGGASRFFYCAKASKSERNRGLENSTNGHPTVKPIKLMEYLIKLITPPNGVVLDPFMGSGSTGVAAKNLGFDFVGMELDQEYFEIAEKRINS